MQSVFAALALTAAACVALAQQPTIPEKARKNYLEGNAAFNNAQSKDDYALAESLYQKAIALAPDWADAICNLSLAQEKLEKYDDAIASRMKCIQLSTPAQRAPSAAADQADVVKGNNAFAVELYGQLKNQSGNLFFSPESISTALAMAYAGARGDTAIEIAKTLHFTLPPDRLHPAIGALLSALNGSHDGYQLRVANALWAEKDFAFLDDFLKLTASDYGAGCNQVNFKGAPDAARLTINQWVAQKTEDKIKDLLQPGVIDSTARMVLTNAVYFKGDWQTPFDKSMTSDEDFHLSPTQSIQAPLMHSTGSFNYFNGRTFQILEIPYKSEDLSMIVFLPNEVNGLPALEQSMTPSSTQEWLDQLRPSLLVLLAMPKFRMTQEIALTDTLGAMGIRQAFADNAADFSGMTGKRNLWISAVIHKAFIDANEVGTEAAAATAEVMKGATAAQPIHVQSIDFRADHPFLFVIRDNRSGAILFMGRVTDPTK